jgi:hypothetical protein
MRRTICALLLLAVALSPPILAFTGSHRQPIALLRRPSSGAAKLVYSHGYGRKDGTYFAPYNRWKPRRGGRVRAHYHRRLGHIR